MHRIVRIVVTALSAVTLAASPALAQDGGYGGPGGTPPTSERPTAGGRVGHTSPRVANPGDPVTFTSAELFAPGTTVDVVLVRGRQGTTGTPVATDVVVGPDGSVEVTFTVPPGTPPGVYFVYAEGVDDAGNTVRSVAVLVVLPEGQGPTDPAPAEGAAAALSAPEDTGGAATAAVAAPPGVREIQVTAEREQELLDAVVDGADLALDDDGRLGVTGQADDASSVAPITAGVAAGGLVLVGLVGLRRRRSRP